MMCMINPEGHSSGCPLLFDDYKSDRYEGLVASPVDAAHVELMSFVGKLNTSVPNIILRTSVTGVPIANGQPPPPPSDRRPKGIVRAYAWLIDQALRRPDKLGSVVPVTSRTPAPVAVTPVTITPELRRVTEQSSAKGRPICDCSDDAQKRVVAFVLDDGAVTEVTVPMRTGSEPTERAIGGIPDLDVPTSELQGEYVGGELLLGSRRQPKYLWVGKKGDLRKTSFGLDIFSWSPINANRIAAVDNAGRLHFLRLVGERWQATDTVDNLAPAGTTGGACQVVNGRSVWVGLGDKVISLLLESDDRIGARSAPIACPGAASFVGNRRGLLCSVIEREKKLFAGVFDGANYHELGEAASPTIAVAQDASVAAWLGPDGKLRGAFIAGAERTILTELTASHPDGIKGLCWTAAGEALVALVGEGTWAVFVPKGIGR